VKLLFSKLINLLLAVDISSLFCRGAVQTKVGTEMTDDEPLHDTADESMFLSGSNVYLRGRPGELGGSMESSSLDESWPDSERNSTVE